MANKLDGGMLKEMVLSAAAILEQNKDTLDAMNVFPVPDGDTGTNMSLTMITAAREVAAIAEKSLDIKSVIKAMSSGALQGARGNSGVILSQIFAGFADAIVNWEGEPSTEMLALAFQRGTEFAYKAVMKPKEGTILTVVKSVADAAELFSKRSDDLKKQMEYCIQEGEKTLKQTPEMLPVLKEAGVVDAGGAGFLVLLMGFKAVLDGGKVNSSEIFQTEMIADFTNMSLNDEIEFGYCTEFFIKKLYPDTQERDIDTYRSNLAKIGDCVLVVGDISLVKTHVHTNEPGLALQYAQILGELSQIKIDNMREQHREIADVYDVPSLERKELAVVTVSAGEGIREIFADWQIDGFVEGGQSMNPSTQDILKVIDSCNADNIIILPNNKNIILAAEQAADLCKHNVTVVKSKSIPQGIAAAVAYNPEGSLEENVQRMNKAIAQVKTGQITNAVRTTKMNGSSIKKGDVIGIADGQIVANSSNLEQVVMDMMGKLTDEDSEIVTIYYGEDVQETEANKLLDLVKKDFPGFDAELVFGGQPVYQYLIAVE